MGIPSTAPRVRAYFISFHFILVIIVLLAAMPSITAAAAANIDVGFAQDGKATYCQGVRSADEGPLVFEELEVASAGSCPIAVQITIPSTTIAPNTTLDVTWSASLYTGAMTTNRFPRAVNATTKEASPVVASLLRACKSGTNCAAGGVVEPATVAGDTSTDSGAFDASGKKTLQRFQFQFPTAGDDYVLVGKVVLGGDQILDISAIEFVAFQRIHVGTDTVAPSTTAPPPPGTIKPANVSGDAAPKTLTTVRPTLVSASAPETPGAKTSTPTDKNVTTTSSGGGVNMQVVSIVGVIGIAVVLIVVGYAFIVHREKQKLVALRMQQNNPSPTVFIRSGPANDGGVTSSFPAPGRQTATVRKSILQPGPQDMSNADPLANSVRKHSRDRPTPPPRPSQPQMQWLKVSEPNPAPPPLPQALRQSSDATLEYSNSGHSDDSVFSLGDATNMSSFDPSNPLAGVPADHQYQSSRNSSVALLESSPTGSELSGVSSLGSLHDSAEHQLAPIARRTFSIDDSSIDYSARESSSIMLESTSYRQTGESSFFRPSSRLYSETLGNSRGPRSMGSSIYYPRDTSEHNVPYTDRNSESDEWVRRTADGHYML